MILMTYQTLITWMSKHILKKTQKTTPKIFVNL